jgi:hypothetical protein
MPDTLDTAKLRRELTIGELADLCGRPVHVARYLTETSYEIRLKGSPWSLTINFLENYKSRRIGIKVTAEVKSKYCRTSQHKDGTNHLDVHVGGTLYGQVGTIPVKEFPDNSNALLVLIEGILKGIDMSGQSQCCSTFGEALAKTAEAEDAT